MRHTRVYDRGAPKDRSPMGIPPRREPHNHQHIPAPYRGQLEPYISRPTRYKYLREDGSYRRF